MCFSAACNVSPQDDSHLLATQQCLSLVLKQPLTLLCEVRLTLHWSSKECCLSLLSPLHYLRQNLIHRYPTFFPISSTWKRLQSVEFVQPGHCLRLIELFSGLQELWHAVTFSSICRCLTKGSLYYCWVPFYTNEQAWVSLFTNILTAQLVSLSMFSLARVWINFLPNCMCWGSAVPELEALQGPRSSQAHWIRTKCVCEKHDLLLTIITSAQAAQQCRTQLQQKSMEYSFPNGKIEKQMWAQVNVQDSQMLIQW